MQRSAVWAAAVAAVLVVGCGSARDRPTGTRNGTVIPDSGVVADSGTQDTPDGGTAGDAGTDPVTPPDRNTLVSDLSEGEKAALCQQIVQAQGTEEVQCDGFTVTPPTYEECLADVPAGSTCTVGMVQDCMDSLNGNACNIFSTTECAALFEC